VTKVVFLLIGWLVLFHAASASNRYAEPEFRVTPKVFTSDDGLPQSGVSTMLQSRDGYLWVGTFGGLARFDGQTFTIFRGSHSARNGGHAPLAQSGPSSDRILALYEDAAAQLWIGTEDAGLNVYANGAFRQLPVCGGTCQINDVLQSSDRSIWAASNAGVLKLDPKTGREVWIRRAAGEGFTRLASDERGRMYVGGYGGFYSVTDDTLRRIELPRNESRVWVLQRMGEALLVGTEYGLYEYIPREQRWRSLGVSQPTYAAQDAEGLWWVLQANGTLVREDGSGGWKNVPELTGMGVISLARDDEGNLWVGTGSKGLLRIRKPLFGVLSAPQLGTNWAGRAVISDGDGGLWLGSACGGLRHWTRDGRMQAVRLTEALGTECVTSLLLDRAGVLWIGSALGSLARIAGGAPEHVLTWDAKEPVNVWQLKDGRYVASAGTSTYLLTPDANGRVSNSRSIRALQGMRVNNVVAAARGGYWFVGDQGVLRLMGEQIVERWTPKEGLSSRFARALYEDEESGDIWVGTYGGGLNRITKGAVYRYDSRNGLFDDAVSCILKDARGRLWLGGNRGVTVLQPTARAESRIASVGYGAHDGLVPAEINGGTSSPCHRDGEGRMWFSLVEGFGMVDPARFPEREPMPSRPRIEHVSAGGRAVNIATATITLPPYTRNLDIRYTAISLARPQETRFRFRLSGVDRDWVEAGQSRNVLYPTVPWGRHLFEVQSITVGGVWSPVSADLLIVHPQPWYLRPWVWTLATLLGLLVLVGSSRLERRAH
jgi:ligand-binding sensor domain-containing protein